MGKRCVCVLFHHWNTGKNPNMKQVNKSSEDVAMFNFLEIKMLKGIWNNKLIITQAYSEHKVFLERYNNLFYILHFFHYST